MLIGHQKIFTRLKEKAQKGQLHHAQLFIGPESVGKSKVALELAVFLQNAQDNVVLRKQMLEGVDADTVLLLDQGENLSIKEIRTVIERTHQSHHRPYLVVLIENLGRMRPEAMNALLKNFRRTC